MINLKYIENFQILFFQVLSVYKMDLQLLNNYSKLGSITPNPRRYHSKFKLILIFIQLSTLSLNSPFLIKYYFNLSLYLIHLFNLRLNPFFQINFYFILFKIIYFLLIFFFI